MKDPLLHGQKSPPQNDNASVAITDEIAQPEADLLRAVFPRAAFVAHVARAPGGWRTLSEHELDQLGLSTKEKNAIFALQALVTRSYPELPRLAFTDAAAVARVYEQRLGGLLHEVVVAIALDAKHHFLAEIEIAGGDERSIAISPSHLLRPLIRAGASAFILVHNHPSGDPKPSIEDVVMTRAAAACGAIIGVPMVDHVIVGVRGGGYVSLLDLGLHEGDGEGDGSSP